MVGKAGCHFFLPGRRRRWMCGSRRAQTRRQKEWSIFCQPKHQAGIKALECSKPDFILS